MPRSIPLEKSQKINIIKPLSKIPGSRNEIKNVKNILKTYSSEEIKYISLLYFENPSPYTLYL